MTSLVRAVPPPLELEVERSHRSWIDAMMPAIELAKHIAGTDFVPAAMRHNPAAVSAAILYGDEIGIGPMVSLNTIKVIDGSPTLLAKIQRALVLAAGHEIWPAKENNETRATWYGRRRGSEEISSCTWTMDRAKKAEIAGRPSWRKYAGPMLSARASAELVGAIFSDVVAGLYATEEIEEPELEPEIAPAAGARDRSARSAGSGSRRARRSVSARQPAAAPTGSDATPGESASSELPPLPGELEDSAPSRAQQQAELDADIAAANARLHEQQTEQRTPAQSRKLHALMREAGIEEKAERARYSSAVIGRVISSSTELTRLEAGRIIDQLEQLRAEQLTAAAIEAGEEPELEQPPAAAGEEQTELQI